MGGGAAAASWSRRRGWPRPWGGAAAGGQPRGRGRRSAPKGRSGSIVLQSFLTRDQAPPALVPGRGAIPSLVEEKAETGQELVAFKHFLFSFPSGTRVFGSHLSQRRLLKTPQV